MLNALSLALFPPVHAESAAEAEAESGSGAGVRMAACSAFANRACTGRDLKPVSALSGQFSVLFSSYAGGADGRGAELVDDSDNKSTSHNMAMQYRFVTV